MNPALLYNEMSNNTTLKKKRKESSFFRKLKYWVYNNLKDPDNFSINSKIFPYVMMENGAIFRTSDDLSTLFDVLQDYSFSDIRKEDYVIDIGANIGGFTILAAKLSDNIIAVEPITIRELKNNIKLNNMNIRIIEGALGDGQWHIITWIRNSKKIKTFSFTQLKQISGGCDFLKCDCEGFEWFIHPEEIEGIRRIEMEIHNFNPSKNNPEELLDYIFKNYNVNIEPEDKTIEEFLDSFDDEVSEVIIIHANKKQLKE